MTNDQEREALKNKWRAGFEREGIEAVRARAVHKRPVAYGVPEQWAEALTWLREKEIVAKAREEKAEARAEVAFYVTLVILMLAILALLGAVFGWR
ncbi:MAG: hypothetical protein WBV18_03790 [Methyloceanibacter sp.]|jgi:hypothetical protein|uniref:hypothetical protein n=1 Tax=Methyloceanibacter sp. TaxID=1965321 RepID=UPI003C3780AE